PAAGAVPFVETRRGLTSEDQRYQMFKVRKAGVVGALALALTACSGPAADWAARFQSFLPPPAVAPAADPTQATLQAVVQRANQEQVDAFTKGDPSLMRDTAASDDYYQQLAQIN